jgi:hypothetical protein
MTVQADAYHEAGHAVAAMALGRPVLSAELADEDGYVLGKDNIKFGGLVRCRGGSARGLVMTALAGAIAEARIRRVSPWPVLLFEQRIDLENAGRAAKSIAKGWFTPERAVRRAEQKTSALLDQHWGAVERIANALIEHRRLDASQICGLFAHENVGAVTSCTELIDVFQHRARQPCPAPRTTWTPPARSASPESFRYACPVLLASARTLAILTYQTRILASCQPVCCSSMSRLAMSSARMAAAFGAIRPRAVWYEPAIWIVQEAD